MYVQILGTISIFINNTTVQVNSPYSDILGIVLTVTVSTVCARKQWYQAIKILNLYRFKEHGFCN